MVDFYLGLINAIKLINAIWVKKEAKTNEAREEIDWRDIRIKVELLQVLIPLGLMAISEQLEEEVEELIAERYSRTRRNPGHCRWGETTGPSVFIRSEIGISVAFFIK